MQWRESSACWPGYDRCPAATLMTLAYRTRPNAGLVIELLAV
jgi:hypothetical protein